MQALDYDACRLGNVDEALRGSLMRFLLVGGIILLLPRNMRL